MFLPAGPPQGENAPLGGSKPALRVRRGGLRLFPAFDRFFGTQAHPVADCAAHGIARGGHQDGRPEHVRRQLDVAEHRGFGAQRQQRGGNERHREDGRQAHRGQCQHPQEPVNSR
ncbi:hypothetical protein G6F57_013178 [Rhizopus arrhizus]|nr:hypothetical protein G6F57_013178 [Rhizopus arrhizus]